MLQRWKLDSEHSSTLFDCGVVILMRTHWRPVASHGHYSTLGTLGADKFTSPHGHSLLLLQDSQNTYLKSSRAERSFQGVMNTYCRFILSALDSVLFNLVRSLNWFPLLVSHTLLLNIHILLSINLFIPSHTGEFNVFQHVHSNRNSLAHQSDLRP